MNIAFYVDEMNLRGVALSTYLFALNNIKILKNKSFIFYNKKNFRNKIEIIKKFKKKFITIGIIDFKEIDEYKEKFKIDYLYTQKSGNKDNWESQKIKTLIHAVYPQKINQIHGYNYAYISEWLSNNFSNKKIPCISLITEEKKITSNLRKNLNIKKKNTIFGCHGGESSFDMKFVQSAVLNIAKKRKDIFFIFLNINKFCNHPQIMFLKGTSNESFKKKFVNTCDAMIYGRSLGESFGLACAEFAIKSKDLISYKFNRHRSHEFNVSKKNFLEYSSYSSLYKLLINYKKKKDNTFNSKYKKYTEKKIMYDFNKFFLRGKNKIQFSLNDYLINYYSHFVMVYLYIRHKMYNHYFNYFYSKYLIK